MATTTNKQQSSLIPLLTQAYECEARSRLKRLIKVRTMIGLFGDTDWADANEPKAVGRLLLALLAIRPHESSPPPRNDKEITNEKWSFECILAIGSMLWNLSAVLACPPTDGPTEHYFKSECRAIVSAILPLLTYKRDLWDPAKGLRPFFEVLNNMSQCPEVAIQMNKLQVIEKMSECPLSLEQVPAIMTLSNLVRAASDKKNRMFSFGIQACHLVQELLPYAMADVNIHSGHYIPAEILLALMGMSENEDNIRCCLSAPFVVNQESEKFADIQQRLQFSSNELRLLPLLIRLVNPEALPGLLKYSGMVDKTKQLAQQVLMNLSRVRAPLAVVPDGQSALNLFSAVSEDKQDDDNNNSSNNNNNSESNERINEPTNTYIADAVVSPETESALPATVRRLMHLPETAPPLLSPMSVCETPRSGFASFGDPTPTSRSSSGPYAHFTYPPNTPSTTGVTFHFGASLSPAMQTPTHAPTPAPTPRAPGDLRMSSPVIAATPPPRGSGMNIAIHPAELKAQRTTTTSVTFHSPIGTTPTFASSSSLLGNTSSSSSRSTSSTLSSPGHPPALALSMSPRGPLPEQSPAANHPVMLALSPSFSRSDSGVPPPPLPMLPLTPSRSLSRTASIPSNVPLYLHRKDVVIMSRLQQCSIAHARALWELHLPRVICDLLLSYCTPWTEEINLDFDLDGDPLPIQIIDSDSENRSESDESSASCEESPTAGSVGQE